MIWITLLISLPVILIAYLKWCVHQPNFSLNRMKLEQDKCCGVARSGKWPTLRKMFLAGSVCAVCGGTNKLEAHHIKPFHLHPELELDEKNLIPLCEGNPAINCHLMVGHLGNFQSINVNSVEDAAVWNKKIKERP